ncbi:hypothetical protein [Manganibacter manganicus]|uniref:Restriction endonuclease n=1 Tax=Manganibacter manganicus TaxID=1873176 RepID=A0A1V8RU31_9HYPH|nr:hypothetical protein [Pseudaminobacter manganicus]OQM76692.1 hypothetical protein BFN67_12310 [Pseudaminobacter manganicus]
MEENERQFRSLSTWGVNHALRRIVPRSLTSRDFKDFPSTTTIQAQADDFIFNCAALELGERYEGWLREGILSGEVRCHPKPDGEGTLEVLVLRPARSSYSDEEIGLSGLNWSSRRITANDRGRERQLEQRHRKMSRDLGQRVELIGGWRVSYSSTPEIDCYFMDWARLYLRRIRSQELIASDDMIGGRPFSRYLEVLTALSARSQKHIAYAAILRARYPHVHIRNLLTSHIVRETFVSSLAEFLDADTEEIETILKSMTLSSENLDVHTSGSETAWAPIVQASEGTLLLPNYGLDINPFLFLLADLRARHERDWFRIANDREGRWIEEICRLFDGPRWQTHDRNLKLRSNGRVETDIDFAVLDRKTNELALFQMKWQHPIGFDNRARRSAGKNFIEEGNRWIETVNSWLDRFGAAELRKRLGFEDLGTPNVRLFVLGRYHAHYAGFDNHDARAVWSDWVHFQRVRSHAPRRSLSQFASDLQSAVNQSRSGKKGESLMLPVGNLAVVFNPSSVPEQ